MPRIVRVEAGDYTYHFPEDTTLFMTNFMNLMPANVALPGMDGAYDAYGQDRPAQAVGSIQTSFLLLSDHNTSRAAREADLNQKLFDLHRIADIHTHTVFMQPEGTTDIYWCKCKLQNILAPQTATRNDELWIEPTILWSAPYPYWRKDGTNAYPPIYGGGFLYGGCAYGGGATRHACSGLQTDFTEHYKGNATAPIRLYVIVGSGQAVTSIKVQRLEGLAVRDEVDYPFALVAGDTLEISGIVSAVVKNSATNAFVTGFSFSHPDWFRLRPGSNSIRVMLGAAGDACSVRLDHYEVNRR